MSRDSMTLDEVIQFTKQALEKVNPDKRVYTEFRFAVWQVKQLLEWLEDYKQLKSDYADLDNRLRTANTEIDRLQSVSSWIPCSERMPDSPIRCAVITENGLYGVSRYMGRNMIEWSLLGDIVTHWMPLPDKPEVS